VLGRFVQPDTVVPEPGNPQALNRYTYVNNNPLKYTDPSGHCPQCILYALWETFFGHGVSSAGGDEYDPVTGQPCGDTGCVTPRQTQVQMALGVAQDVVVAEVGARVAGAVLQKGAGALRSALRGGGRTAEVAGKKATLEAALKLRQEYEDAVRGLAGKAEEMRAAGHSAEEIARALHAERRALGEQFKAMTPPDALEQIYARNLEKYGDKLGPPIEWLIQRGLKQGKLMEQIWEDIIESASRPGGKDILPQLQDR
jgi:hypothetical protein